MERITELYRREELDALLRANTRRRRFLAAGAALLLAGCVLLCALSNTANAERLELYTILLSAVGGWVLLYVAMEVLIPGRREAAHAQRILDARRSTVTGVVTLGAARIRIPGSIAVLPLAVRTEQETVRLLLNESKARLLPPLPRRLTLYTVDRYVAAFSAAEGGDEP